LLCDEFRPKYVRALQLKPSFVSDLGFRKEAQVVLATPDLGRDPLFSRCRNVPAALPAIAEFDDDNSEVAQSMWESLCASLRVQAS